MAEVVEGNGHRRRGLVVALVSAKASPGVTTTAVGLAARWLRPGAVIVEADPAGGDLGARFGRDVERGLAAVALDSRDAGGGLEPQRWVQTLPCGVPALLAPPGVEASASLEVLAEQAKGMLSALAGAYPAVLVDAGRWWPGSPAETLISAADVLLVVARPTLEELSQVESRAEALRALAGDIRLVLVGDGPWPPGEVAARLRLPVADVLPTDRHGASVLSGRSVPRRGWSSTGWTRLPLLRACRGLAGALHGSATQATAPPPSAELATLPAPQAPRPPAEQTVRR
jgi:hypothetical protein